MIAFGASLCLLAKCQNSTRLRTSKPPYQAYPACEKSSRARQEQMKRLRTGKNEYIKVVFFPSLEPTEIFMKEWHSQPKSLQHGIWPRCSFQLNFH